MYDAIGFWVRACVATTFVLSAGWKSLHVAEFRAVLRSMTPTRPLAPVLVVLVPLAEVAVAVLLIVPGDAGRLGGVAAVAIVVVLSTTLLRPDLSAGCGCWSGAHPERGPLVVRNAVLLVLAAAAALLPPSPASAELLVVVPIAAVFGVLVIEIPTVLQYLAHAEGAPS